MSVALTANAGFKRIFDFALITARPRLRLEAQYPLGANNSGALEAVEDFGVIPVLAIISTKKTW